MLQLLCTVHLLLLAIFQALWNRIMIINPSTVSAVSHFQPAWLMGIVDKVFLILFQLTSLLPASFKLFASYAKILGINFSQKTFCSKKYFFFSDTFSLDKVFTIIRRNRVYTTITKSRQILWFGTAHHVQLRLSNSVLKYKILSHKLDLYHLYFYYIRNNDITSSMHITHCNMP